MGYFLESRRQIGLIGDIDLNALNHFLHHLQDNVVLGESVEIFLTTSGGKLSALVAILAQLRTYREAGIVRTLGSGLVASAGLSYLAAGTKGERYIVGSDTRLMMHEYGNDWSGTIPTAGLDVFAENSRIVQEAGYRRFAALTSRPAEWWKARMEAKGDVYFTPEEAIEWGIVDHVVEVMPPALPGVKSKSA